MTHNLAQLNIAKMLASINDPIMVDFVNNLDRINSLAEGSKGFVWRLKGDDNNATALRVFADNFMLINMSVWKDRQALFEFTYNSGHVSIMRRKKDWFSKMKDMHMVLWYIENGSVPSPEEAKQRLAYIRSHGETPYAFSFKSNFSIEDLISYNIII